jgi:ferrous iron transport protein A
MVTLDCLQVGEVGIVKRISNEEIKRRFLDIGLIQDTRVECLLESPFHNPKAYLIKGASIAIRKEDAKAIEVEVI